MRPSQRRDQSHGSLVCPLHRPWLPPGMEGSKIVENGSGLHRQCAADLLREAGVRGGPEEVFMAAIKESLSGCEGV